MVEKGNLCFVLNVCLRPPDVWAFPWRFRRGSQRWYLVHLSTKMAFENCVSEDFDTQHSLTPRIFGISNRILIMIDLGNHREGCGSCRSLGLPCHCQGVAEDDPEWRNDMTFCFGENQTDIGGMGGKNENIDQWTRAQSIVDNFRTFFCTM